jgi:outer membrane protein OmpA-like peptidoglycan-associated protein
VNAVASVVAVMTSYLVSGDVGWDGTASRATGVYTNGLAQAAFQIAADAVGVTTVLNERPAASPQDASDIEAALNSLVSAEPILFKPGTADISPESQTTLQKVAGIAKRFGGLRIEAQGHTDSLGTTAVNQELSERRARAVVAALESYGVPAGDLASIGFGETQLVVDANGKEIPEQSRRVVFGVTTV